MTTAVASTLGNQPETAAGESVALDAPVVYLPVRHHSPACAWHVDRFLRARPPAAVLIEGPSDANALLDALADDETVPPVALYGFVRATDDRPPFASWYPFCIHSPEYVALRVGREMGVEVAFIDIPSWWHASLRTAPATNGPAATNAYGDHQLRFHSFMARLCSQTNTRDFDELWDTLFEVDGAERPPGRFWSDVATYCDLARAHSSPDEMAADGTGAREAYMAARIREFRARHADSTRPIVVLIGGFHRAGLLALADDPSRAAEPTPPPIPKASELGCYLAAYGDRQLDRWSGYQSGMPAPAFYRSLWQSLADGEDPRRLATSLLARLGKFVRAQVPVSTADLIAADRMLGGLVDFRGHRRLAREDLRDAVRSTWIKGSVDETHGHLLTLLDEFLVGVSVGRVAAAAGAPPLIADFEAEIRAHRLPGKPTATGRAAGPRQLALDIFRRPAHRRRSAFLHRLRELDIPYARLEAGPDLTRAGDPGRLREIWRVAWRPAVEGALLENAIHGATVAEAAQNHLLARFRRDQGLGAAEATDLLTAALVMDLPELSDELADSVNQRLATEGRFSSMAEAFGNLIHLLAYRPILDANRFPAIEAMARFAYRRASALVDELPGLARAGAEEEVEGALAGLARLRHAALAAPLPDLDPELFFAALGGLKRRLGRLPLLEGAVLGILRQAGHATDAEVRAALMASADNTLVGPDFPLGDFLRGLLRTVRHAFLANEELLRLVHDCVITLPEERFRAALPALRLAFRLFAAHELQRIAGSIAGWLERPPPESAGGERPPRAPDSVSARIEEAWRRFGLD